MIAWCGLESNIDAPGLQYFYHLGCICTHASELWDGSEGLLFPKRQVGVAALVGNGIISEPLDKSLIPERPRDTSDIGEHVALDPLPQSEQPRQGHAYQRALR